MILNKYDICDLLISSLPLLLNNSTFIVSVKGGIRPDVYSNSVDPIVGMHTTFADITLAIGYSFADFEKPVDCRYDTSARRSRIISASAGWGGRKRIRISKWFTVIFATPTNLAHLYNKPFNSSTHPQPLREHLQIRHYPSAVDLHNIA